MNTLMSLYVLKNEAKILGVSCVMLIFFTNFGTICKNKTLQYDEKR